MKKGNKQKPESRIEDELLKISCQMRFARASLHCTVEALEQLKQQQEELEQRRDDLTEEYVNYRQQIRGLLANNEIARTVSEHKLIEVIKNLVLFYT